MAHLFAVGGLPAHGLTPHAFRMPRREPPTPPPDPRQLSFPWTRYEKPAFVTMRTRDGLVERVRIEDLSEWIEKHRIAKTPR